MKHRECVNFTFHPQFLDELCIADEFCGVAFDLEVVSNRTPVLRQHLQKVDEAIFSEDGVDENLSLVTHRLLHPDASEVIETEAVATQQPASNLFRVSNAAFYKVRVSLENVLVRLRFEIKAMMTSET